MHPVRDEVDLAELRQRQQRMIDAERGDAAQLSFTTLKCVWRPRDGDWRANDPSHKRK
jgi:hypothetical protein